jgi:TRAP-type mannitol/chloroaromatic compound transport system permease large subunit
LLAFFLDFFEIAFIVLPLFAPVARHLDIDMVWLTVLLAVNLQTSFMHPPFGIALYNLRSVTPPSVPTSQIHWGSAVPFLGLQVLMVGLLIVAPQIVTKVPSLKVDASRIQILLPPPPD